MKIPYPAHWVKVVIPWPKGDSPEGADPNHVMRPWLEEHVGEQTKNWNWEICFDDTNSLSIWLDSDVHATLIKMQWT